MQREEIHATALRLRAIPLREHHTIEKVGDLHIQWPVRNVLDEFSESQHRRWITLVCCLFRPHSLHESDAAKPLDQVIDRRDGLVIGTVAVVALQTTTVAAERKRPCELAKESSFVAERSLVL